MNEHTKRILDHLQTKRANRPPDQLEQQIEQCFRCLEFNGQSCTLWGRPCQYLKKWTARLLSSRRPCTRFRKEL